MTPDHAATVLLAEYDKLKTEQIHRIGVRDNLVYATLATIAAVTVAAVQTPAGVRMLLALPPACVVLGWTFLANDRMVTAIGAYLRRELIPGLDRQAGQPVMRWEFDHTGDRRRRQRKRVQLAVDLGTFCLPGLAAVHAYWALAPWQPLLFAISLADFAVVAGLAYLIAAYRDAGQPSKA